MGYHILISNKQRFKKCLELGVYGGSSFQSPALNAEIISSFEAIKPGDFIFFYVTGAGVYGLWRATSRVFFDDAEIWGEKDQIYPYRVCFEPSIRNFPEPISLSDVLDLRDKGKMWTFDLGGIRKKNHNPITADEGKELIRLLLRSNPIQYSVIPIQRPYQAVGVPLLISFELDNKGRLKYEGLLNYWFMKCLVEDRLKDVIGEYRDFLNYVPTSFNKQMDIFLTHVTVVDSVDILHKFTCIELKTETCEEKDLNQIIKYENWLIRKLAGGDSEMVQSMLVAFDFDDRVLEYVRKRKLIEEKSVRLLNYKVTPEQDDLILSEVKPG
jgi:hypothetical protein